MCYNGKCLHCMEVETGSLIFAILNVMGTSLGSVVSVGGLVYTTFFTQAVLQGADDVEDEGLVAGALLIGLTANAVFAILSVFLLISFSFAVVLLVGLCKRKANLVKCFFVFSMMKIVVGIAVMIGVIANGAEFSALIPAFFINIDTVLFWTRDVYKYWMWKEGVFDRVPFDVMAVASPAIYGLILVMIHNTYKKFEAEVPYNAFTNQMCAVQKF